VWRGLSCGAGGRGFGARGWEGSAGRRQHVALVYGADGPAFAFYVGTCSAAGTLGVTRCDVLCGCSVVVPLGCC
jgi:hypothetical protein